MSDKTAPDVVPELSKRFDAMMRERGWRFASITRVGEKIAVHAYGKHGDWGVTNAMTDGWTRLPDPGPTLTQLADELETHAVESGPPKLKGDDQC